MKKPLLSNRGGMIAYNIASQILRWGLKVIIITACTFGGDMYSQGLQIVGDSSVCSGTQTDYLAENLDPDGSLIWDLPRGGGVILGPNDEDIVTITWGSTGGVYTIRLRETTPSGNNTAFYLVEIERDGSVSCNNLVQVSVDANCEALIEADIILEGEIYPNDSYQVVVYDKNGNPVPNATVNGNHIGQLLSVTVTHLCTGNTCWGTIAIEDKWIPMLMCGADTIACGESTLPEDIGFPVDSLSGPITQTNPGSNEYYVPNYDLCGPIIIRYTDQKVNKSCDDEFYSIIYRTWYATDESGNTISCVDTIFIERGDLGSVVFPQNFDDIEQPVLLCNAKTPPDPSFFSFPWNALPNGNPSPYDFKDAMGNIIYYGTGLPSGTGCDHLATTFKDIKIDVCGGTFKILRKWRVLDWCSGQIVEDDQLIKVVDYDPPIAVCPPNDTVGTKYYTCEGRAKIEPPLVIEECSDWSYIVLHKPADGSGNPDPSGATDENVTLGQDGFYYIDELPLGRSWIVYIISDECGNTTECVSEIDVIDDRNPVAICDEHTVVTLNEFGKAEIYATSIDQGSFDNCEVDSFAIRRMTNNCQNPLDLKFGRYVNLCCEDVSASPIMVVFRVWDLGGNFNDCMVEVTVQDKIPPRIECPEDITINCTQDYKDLDLTGHPNIIDECGIPSIRFTDNISNLDDCGVGTVRRRFIAEDISGRIAVCDQIITLVNIQPLREQDINWPADISIEGCTAVDADPKFAGKPTYPTRPCSKIASSYSDDIFYDIDELCLKIHRTWTVIDWCQYDAQNPTSSSGKWQHHQKIEIYNSIPPEILDCETIEVCAGNQNCNGLVELIKEAVDDCTLQRDLIWRYEVDLFSDGTIDSVGNSNDATDLYPVGSHIIYWYAIDECGNEGSCEQEIIVNDCKQPTPYCEPGIVTVIMPTTGSVAIWASDFDAGSFDDCTPNNKLRFSFSSDVNDKGRTFTCDSLNGKMQMRFTVTVYVTDEAGNQDFCTTEVIIQANNNSCPNISGPIIISGDIKTIYDKECANVEVNFSKDRIPMSSVFTSVSGKFQAQNLDQGYMYTVRPYSDENLLDNVSTADLIRIQRHLLGLDIIKSPHALIAADINNSGSISAKDLVTLRKAILGIDKKFENNTSWRFIDARYNFNDPTNPWLFPELMDLDTLSRDYDRANFVAVKIGDVTGNLTTFQGQTTSRSTNKFLCLTNELIVAKDDIIEVPVKSTYEGLLTGIQMTIDYRDMFDFVSVKSAKLQLNTENISYHALSDGLIPMVWFDAEGIDIQDGDVLFTIELRATKSGNLSKSFDINSRITQAVAFVDGDESKIDLSFIQIELANKLGLSASQNFPNPFEHHTTIPFSIEKSQEVVLEVFDVSGKLIYKNSMIATKGFNKFELVKNDLNSRGILFYKLRTSDESVEKRMILLD